MDVVKLKRTISLNDYAGYAPLHRAVEELRAEAAMLVPRVGDRKIWIVNSAAHGGGVAEMLPMQAVLLRELGVNAHWAVMKPRPEEFFRLTKHLHNLIHGDGDPRLGPADRRLYEAVSRATAKQLRAHVGKEDILIVHDPQPLGAGALLKRDLRVRMIWRCHIGLDRHTPATRSAWEFLKPYAEVYDQAVFSAPEYIPDFLSGRTSIIHPALDPLSHKNRSLSPHKLVGVLCNAGLSRSHGPVLTPPFSATAQRLQPDGTFGPAAEPNEIGLLYRPIVAQISRWDRLKGFGPLLEGFLALKRRLNDGTRRWPPRQRRRLQILRLVMAGPDPSSIQDDPEAEEMLEGLRHRYCQLQPAQQQDVVLLTLPMVSRKHNALMVNALQRCATVVAQNSIREGFGLTATEAMWKAVPVMGTRACGLRQQIRDGVDGRLVSDPDDPEEIARVLTEMLCDPCQQEAWGRNAQLRVHREFLVFSQLSRWLRLLTAVAERPPG
jgi:trehalose synthase